jgi:hypothetical protein
MATNDQVTPFGRSMNRFAREKALSQIAQTGRSLPCQVVKVMGSIVQVSFQVQAVPGQAAVTIDNVTIPIIGSEYIRLPIQPGCKGMTVAADAYLGGMSGQGGGVATLTRPANLTALAFVPLGNVGFFSVNGQVLTMYGPGGVTLMDQNQTTEFNLTPGKISMSAGGHSVVISSAGVVIDGKTFLTHEHSNGNMGANTGGVV